MFIKSLFIALSLALCTSVAFATVHVRSHVRKNGSFVQSHYRTDKDSVKFNNWSHKGNVNPYTGKKGYKND